MVAGGSVLGGLWYMTRMNDRVVDDLVVNMVDVGEETGELDTMLYKVADTYDEEVKTMTDGLMALLEPLLICFLGGARRFHRDVAVHAVGRLDFEVVVVAGRYTETVAPRQSVEVTPRGPEHKPEGLEMRANRPIRHGLHTGRDVGGDCDHRHPGRAAAAGDQHGSQRRPTCSDRHRNQEHAKRASRRTS